ncbi:uncharacterized protein FIESC28_03242 [Fusarium coffeatum]|uniref:Xylanolytic transcriptional activator regulatory domain-containing protein n=1 Tax=Fusarium coffeatum TaxID=231269 RepID=A0A366S4J8_9HYPO|nr:uncharacterized protein FIESC28_03242 [Fusarium coffeatum]RBR23932.1 hypothetical protein FIESC28_03242 [Fusarium coffeatum]
MRILISEEKVDKRNRPPRSCEPCRQRNETRIGKNSSVAERLKHLESLLVAVAGQKGPIPPIGSNTAASVSPTNVSKDDSEARIDDTVPSGLPNHLDSSHWSSILDDIKAIREDLPSESPESMSENSPPEAGLQSRRETSLDFDLGLSDGVSMESVLAALPSREVCDTLTSMFFRWHYNMMPILHPVKFQQEYEEFWKEPASAPPIWIALLLALLSLSAGVFEASGMGKSSPMPIPTSSDLSRQTKQCLLLSDYIGSNEHAVEAFLLHLVGSWLLARASDTRLWFLMGKVVQLALCKGYHRDSSRMPNGGLSPFDGEMRRRVWVCIFQLDALMSFQLGLPSMVPSDCCDTDLPGNLNESQLHPDITELPPSRPLSENTTILYSIVKASIMAEFKNVSKHTRSPTTPSLDATFLLDAQVRKAYNDIPDNFKYRPLTNFLTEDMSVVITRTTLALLHLKTLIVLHRQHLTYRRDSRSEASRNACLKAAGRLLEIQAEMHRVTQPGGRLYDMKWLITSLTLSDFTLGAMVICLDLTVTMKLATEAFHSPASNKELQGYLTVIQDAHNIWLTAEKTTSEARTIAHALGSTIHRVNEFLSTRSLPGSSEMWQTLDGVASVSMEDGLYMNPLDMIDGTDWTLIDNQFQDPDIQEFDLDMWLMETAGPFGAND